MISRIHFSCAAFSLLACVCAIASGAEQVTFDGSWWQSVEHDQRLGFVEGYVDCSALVSPKDQFYNGTSFEEIVKQGDAFYDRSVQDRVKPVPMVLRTVANPRPVKAVPRSTFGLFDGEDWRQGTRSFRLGFIQGYRNCYDSSEDKKEERFTKSDEWYVQQISGWYGVSNDDPSAINPKRYKRMIAQVLFLLKDPARGAPGQAAAPGPSHFRTGVDDR